MAGDDLLFWYQDMGSIAVPDFAASHAQVFDRGTIERLQRLWIAVIGASGTGSLVIEQLMRLGVGALAEYVTVRDAVVAKPANLTFEEAAAVPVAAITALQGLRDKGRLEAGQQVLINGASGGVGTFAIQIAKALGAEVTAVCSTGNVEAARRGGADRVVDYTKEDVRSLGETFDLFFDNAGSLTLRDSRRLVSPGGSYVMVTSPKSKWLRPLPRQGQPSRSPNGRRPSRLRNSRSPR